MIAPIRIIVTVNDGNIIVMITAAQKSYLDTKSDVHSSSDLDVRHDSLQFNEVWCSQSSDLQRTMSATSYN